MQHYATAKYSENVLILSAYWCQANNQCIEKRQSMQLCQTNKNLQYLLFFAVQTNINIKNVK